MFEHILSASIHGLSVLPVKVEADVGEGLPQFVIVGSPSHEVRESQDRIRSAFRNNSIDLPPHRITINLAPGDIPKSGSGFDLPIALVLLAALRLIPKNSLGNVMALGELGLNGELHRINGILPIAQKAEELGIHTLVVPSGNEGEARCASALNIVAASNLKEVIQYFRDGTLPLRRKSETSSPSPSLSTSYDFADIRGQESAKRAAVISVSGFHNFLMIGPPGSGKSMIAKRIPTILPPLSHEEQIEISAIYSIAGLLEDKTPLITTRPFRDPHHTISPQALAGGGLIPHPGEVTLSHRGILFLDELPEFNRNTLEILRQPLENREIVISRTSGTYRYPANFLLLAAMNPCPCGYYPDHNRCVCSSSSISRYQSHLSKPLLDRIDLCCSVQPVNFLDLIDSPSEDPMLQQETSKEIRKTVAKVHEIQSRRYSGTTIRFNSEIPASSISAYCPMSGDAMVLLRKAFDHMGLSARSYHRVIRVARTIADLEAEEIIQSHHLAESLSYRTITKDFWKLE